MTISKVWRHYQSLGVNCEAGFQFRRILGRDHSSLFLWNVTPLATLKAMLASDLSGLGQRENLVYEGNGDLVRDRLYDYHFHWDGDHTLFPDGVSEEDFQRNAEKLAYLANKFDTVLNSGESIAFFYTCQDPVGATALSEIADLLRARAPGADFTLVVLRHEQDLTPDPEHPDIIVRRLKRFAPWSDASDGHLASWDEVFKAFPHEDSITCSPPAPLFVCKGKTMTDTNLIFDLGLHKGLDTKYYLAKGFHVIGLEAVPRLCETAHALNEAAVADGRLSIVNRALHTEDDATVSFFVNPDKDDWGSLDRQVAEKRGGAHAVEITTQTITLQQLFALHGQPYYIKCDLEGGDAIFVSQLLAAAHRPDFVSIEATNADDLAMLRACGYTKFQIVNQCLNFTTRAPNPAREGIFVDQNFSDEMSGLFGRDLPAENWRHFTDIMVGFLDWYDLRARHPQLAIGWLDVHATAHE